MAQMQLLPQTLTPGDIVYTPDWVACDMVNWFKPSGRILEPCKGEGAIYKYLPAGSFWCEIQEGKDFFAWNEKVDWIITNPPYSLFKEFLWHGFSVAENVVLLIPFHNFFRSGSVMETANNLGWVKHMRFYGAGGKLGFPMGNPVGAMHFVRGYQGVTSWSWYAPNTACTGLATPSAPEVALHKNRSGKRGGSALPANQ